MIINQNKLYEEKPMCPMYGIKLQSHGVSYGLSEAAVDLQII
jgi:hypothetical protein